MSFSVDVLSGKTAFVWDFDGSFCDTEQLHYRAYAAAFAEWGHELKEDGYYLRFTHLGEGARKELAECGMSIPLEALLAAKKRHYMRLISSEPLPLFEHIETILTRLLERGRIAIASNSPRDEIDLILERTGLGHFPSLVVGREGELRKKPFPDIFQAAYARLGVTPHEVLVFEDSERGLLAAAASGAQSVLLLTPFNRTLSFQAPYALACSHEEFVGVLTRAQAT
ncbi:MAG: HAD family phosphatase [Silvanigrellales bacterium]|nr:HAD family phosphatase [Silvanigrellales bacterium]